MATFPDKSTLAGKYVIDSISVSVVPNTSGGATFPSPSESQTTPGEFVGSTREQVLQFHVSYRVIGYKDIPFGHVVVESDPITTITYDENGNVTDFEIDPTIADMDLDAEIEASKENPTTLDDFVAAHPEITDAVEDDLIRHIARRQELLMVKKALNYYNLCDNGIEQI